MTVTGRDPATGIGIAVGVADGVIAGIRETSEPTECWLGPGLVDLQVNGYRGIDLNDGRLTPDRVSELTRALVALGVTTFAPTLITAPEKAIVDGLRAIAAARVADPLVRHVVPFVHVEGPFLSREDGPRGAHPLAHVRPFDLDEVIRWQNACGRLVGLVTLSPHGPDAPRFIRALVASGIRVAIGHTGATPPEIRAAVDAGATLSTHLGNGIGGMLPRHPNLIWAQLAEDRLAATFIADGHHLPADTLTVMLRAKGPGRSILVSDCAALAGMPPGIYDQPIGGRVEVSADGRIGIPGTPYLAGAGRSLVEDVALAAALARLPIGDALALATANPGRIAGGRGRIALGAPADLLRFRWKPGDRALQAEQVVVLGEKVA